MLMIIYEEPLFLFWGSDKNFIKISQNAYNITKDILKINQISKSITNIIKQFKPAVWFPVTGGTVIGPDDHAAGFLF